jgi:hypothetical protein
MKDLITFSFLFRISLKKIFPYRTESINQSYVLTDSLNAVRDSGRNGKDIAPGEMVLFFSDKQIQFAFCNIGYLLMRM